MSPSFQQLLPVLANHEVRFIIIGGIAGMAHGAARATYDIDVVYARDSENIKHLVEALRPHQPYLRGAPTGLPFAWDERTVLGGLNFTLTTTLGPIDLLGEVAGGGFYEELLPFCDELEVFGIKCRVVGVVFMTANWRKMYRLAADDCSDSARFAESSLKQSLSWPSC